MASQDVEISNAALSKREKEDVALVSARAFHSDPFFAFLSPGALRRSRGLNRFGLTTAQHLGPKGLLLTARRGGKIVGVGGWVAPGGYPYPVRDQVLQTVGALRALYPSPTSLLKGLKYLTAVEKAHPKEHLWYLQLLCCDPEHQRSGVGGALQGEVLRRCDAEGIGAYLETQNEDNLAYYRRFGWELVDTLRPLSDGPPIWTMRREPRAT
ncbi:MAG TPA: GNAT family N-acetyltransferase [Acidimicrobiales bacterium]|nr:GNAT family N-acetyltransferase [Acidimicrobiales bacterium]